MSYKALSFFRDMQDNGHLYKAGDVYPRAGYEPDSERIKALASNNNKRGTAVIVEVVEPKPVEEGAVPETKAVAKRGRKTTAKK